MELLKLGKDKANEISNYNSVSAFYSKLMRTDSPTNIGFINIEGEDNTRISLKNGEGVFWNKGEGHISGSETGLTALVLQSEDLKNPLK